MAPISIPVGFLVASLALSAQRAAADAESPQAFWKDQEISFHFQSFTTFYSCDGLERKLKRILKALGVKDANVRVQSPDCHARSPAAWAPRVIINARTPVEVTPEAIAERDRNKSTRELAARVQGDRDAAKELTEQFQATWKRVSLSRGSLGLEPGDCELVAELKRQLLPKLAVRMIEDHVACSQNSISVGQPKLEVEALVVLPKPDEKASEKR